MLSEPNDYSVEGQAGRRDEEPPYWLTVLPVALCVGVVVIVFLVSLLS